MDVMSKATVLVVLAVVAAAVATPLVRENSTYAERTAWYAEHSALNGGEDLWADVARAHVNKGQLSSAYVAAVAKLARREDGSDFLLPAIALLLFRYDSSPIVHPEARAALRGALLDFQYWPDEGGEHGNLQYWSENHAVLYHASEYVIGAALANETFSNSGMTGAQHRDKGRELLLRWMDLRSRLGYNEFCSEVYATFVTSALSLVVDLGPDAEVATRAAMLLDLQLLDLSLNSYAGVVSGFRGRTYENNKMAARGQSTSQVIWLLTGVGRTDPAGRGAVSLAVSRGYRPLAAIEAVGGDRPAELSAGGRVGIATSEGPAYGLGYSDAADGIVWFGMGAYAAPDTIELFFTVPTEYDMWDHEVWEPLQPLRPLAGTGVLPVAAELLWPLSLGSVLGPISTSIFRTPYAALGTAVEYNAGLAGYQQHTWQATLGGDAIVFATHPGPNPSDYALSLWTGGASMSRTSQYRSVLVALSRPPWPTPLDALYPPYTHAYFPSAAFEEVRQKGQWTFARLGDGYLALYSARPTRWQDEGEYAQRELIAEGGAENVWIAEIGSAADDGSFDDFVARVSGGTVDAAWQPGTGELGDGLVQCIYRTGCFDPEDPVGSLTDCIVRVPVVNPKPPCGSYADVAALTRCVADCGEGAPLCVADCVRAHIVIDPPTYVPGEIHVRYEDAAGRVVTYSWNEPLRVTTGGSTVAVYPETYRYRSPYVVAPWGSRNFTISAGGHVACLDFDAPSRTEGVAC